MVLKKVFNDIVEFLFPFKAIQQSRYAHANPFLLIGVMAVSTLVYYMLIGTSIALVGMYTILFSLILVVCIGFEFGILFVFAKLLKIEKVPEIKKDIFNILLLRYILSCAERIVVFLFHYNQLVSYGLLCITIAYVSLIFMLLMKNKYKLTSEKVGVMVIPFILEFLYGLYNLFHEIMLMY